MLNTPLWLTLCLGAAVLFLLWRHHTMARLLKKHAESIGNMDAWADTTDERLDRLDWSGRRHAATNDRNNIGRRTG